MLKKEQVRDKISDGWMHCRTIIQIVGAPKEYIEKTLKEYVAKIRETKGIGVIKENFSDTEPQEKLFSIFVEIEMVVKDASTLAFFCYDYMPSSIEIIEPQTFNYRAADFAAFFNDLLSRLHTLDAIVKQYRAQNQILEKNAGLLLRNNILITLKEKEKNLKELSKNNGIPENQLKPFLDKIIIQGYIQKKKDKYSLVKKKK